MSRLRLLGRLVRTVQTPLGDKTEHYFSVSLDNSFTGWNRFDYGLPSSRFESAGGTPERFRSTKVYDCDAAGNNCVLRRTTYVAYERDAAPAAKKKAGTHCAPRFSIALGRRRMAPRANAMQKGRTR